MFTSPLRWFCVSLFVHLACLSVLSAHGQSVWNSGTGNWTSAGNWMPSSIPVSGASTALLFEGGSDYTTTNDIGNFSLNRLVFSNTSGTVTLNGAPTTNALLFVNSGTAQPSITLAEAGSATIAAPITWNANTTVTNGNSGALTFSGTPVFANGTKQTFTNSGSGSITLGDGLTYSSTGSNTGLVLNLINNNNATGSFNIGDMGGLGNVTFNIGGTGTVRFNGPSADDLFSGSVLLNVLSGATFDFNGNAETMGAISGAGTILHAGLTLSSTGYYVVSGRMRGASAQVTVGGATHTLVLSGSTSDYTGATTITAGRVIVEANAPNGSAGALGNATSDVLVGNTSGTSNSILMIGSSGVTVGRNVRLQSGNSGVAMVGGLNASGTATYSGNVILGTNSAAAKALTISSTRGGTVEFTGNLLRATSATGATDTLTLRGGGTVIFKGNNTFTGATTVSGGTLLLDYTTNNGSKLSSTAALTMNGGALSLIGNNLAATSQTVNGVTLGNAAAPLGGGARFLLTTGTDQNATLNLGALTRNTGATADFAIANTGTGLANITTSTPNNAVNILGAYATFARNNWAVNDGSGNLSALAAGSYSSSFTTGQHTSLAANTALPSGGATTNTLRFTNTAALTFNATPGTLVLESGGILVASTAGATSIGNTTTRGTLSSSTSELIIHQQSTTGSLTINSVISGTNLTKTGDGTLVLTGTNTYTGNTIINGGTVSVTNVAHLGAVTSDVTINGGTLALPSGGSLGTLNAANRVITIGPAGATFNFTANHGFEGSGLTGTGTLTLAGPGALTFGSSASTFTGDIIINNGSIRMNSNQLQSVANITVNSGGTYEVNDDGAGTFNIATGGRYLLNGNGLGNNGAMRLTDQTGATSRFDPTTTIPREVELQTTSRIQVENGSAIGSVSQLILTGNISGAGGLVKTGNGILTLTSRDNTYSGTTTISAGTLRLNLGHDRLPTETQLILGTGTTSGLLQLNGYSQTVGSLTTTGTGTTNAITNGSATAPSLFTVNLAAGNQTYAGSLGATGNDNRHAANNFGFIKSGPGDLLLTGANTFSGETGIASGTLSLGHAQALGNRGASYSDSIGGTLVSAGATLDLNGQSQVQEVITLNGTGVAGAGALINNSTTPASLGNGIASLSLTGVTTTGWTAGATVSIDAPGAGTPATATALLGLTSASLSLTTGGSGFGLAPVVTVTGGTGAVVTALVGVTTASYTVVGGTTVYSTAPTVTLQNGATATAILSGGSSGTVVGITVTNPGTGFGGTPTLTFSGGTIDTAGTAPTATGNNNNYTVVGFTVVNAGSNFTSTPVITITGGTGATAQGNDSNFALNGIALTDNGSGYTSTPNVTINGGTATATANRSSILLASDSSIGGSGDLTVHSVITGDFGLTKVGSGTTTLNAINTYLGTTLVNAGNLQVGTAGVGSTGPGQLTVNGSGAILSGTGNITASTTSVILGTLMPGDTGGSSIGTLRTQNLTFAPTSATTVAELQLTGSTNTADLAFDKITINGDLTLNSLSNLFINGSGYTANIGDTFTMIDWSGLLDSGSFSTGSNLRTGANSALNEGNLDLPDISSIGLWDIAFGAGQFTLVVVVPEPSRALLLLLGLVALFTHRRRP